MTDAFVPRPAAELALDWPPELDHFSASSAKMAVRCLEQWRQRYVLGKKIAPSLSMLAGRADHGAIERSMVQKVTSFIDLPAAEVKDAYVEILEREVENAGGIGEIEVRDADTQAARVRAFDKERAQGQVLVEAYHTQASPTIQPLAVEKKIEIQVPGLPVRVDGYVDLIAVPALQGRALWDPDEKVIVDRKRRARASTKIEPEWSIQAEVYQLAEPLPFDFHLSIADGRVVVGDERLRLPVPPRERSERLLGQIVSMIGFCYMKYGPDEPWPTNGKLHPWACGYCGYRPDCWGWKEG